MSTTRPTQTVAGPQHISSSVPTEFEGMLDEAAVLAPEGLEHPLKYLQSRILARHFHAMLKRGVTLVTVHLEPGLRASGLNLWLLEVLAACILCFDGPWIAMADWNVEPNDLAQVGWLDTVNGKVAATSAAACAGGAGAVLDYFVLSEAMAHLVQQVKVVDNSPTTPHSPVSLTLTATSWGHRVLARSSPRRCQWDRDARKSNLNGLGLQRSFLPICSWPGWSGCAQQKLHGAGSMISAGPNAGLFWGGAKDWSSNTFPSARQRATIRGDAAAKRPQLGVPFAAWWRRRLAAWPDGGRGELRRVRCNSQSTCSLQSRYPILAPGTQAGSRRKMHGHARISPRRRGCNLHIIHSERTLFNFVFLGFETQATWLLTNVTRAHHQCFKVHDLKIFAKRGC